MAYKDKDKQREAAKERARRYRNAHKTVTPSVTPTVTPKHQYDYHSTNTSNHELQGQALIKHLEQTSIEQLKAEGYWIPAWKYVGDTFPLEGLKAAMASQGGFNE